MDFYCPSVKLAVEIDGIAHEMGDGPERDERRDDFVKEQGIAVLRIPAQDVLHDVEGMAVRIVRYVESLR